MYKIGYVVINNETYGFDKCLFDSGAQSDNYIATNYVNSHIDIFKDFILEHASTVKLGDSKTTVNITHIITLNIAILDSNHTTHNALLNFSIMDIEHLDMIIGINSILFSYFDLFSDMLKSARADLHIPKSTSTIATNKTTVTNIYNELLNINDINMDPPLCTSNNIPDTVDYIGCTPTWIGSLDELAPEELETPQPCSFSGPLEQLGSDRQEVLNKYYNVLTTNINPEFVAACPAVMLFMKSPIALQVFCPEVWTGINGLEEIQLGWSRELPARLRTKVREVKPAFLSNAITEFDRLRTYFYTESTSPVTSPLCIAPKPTPPYLRFCGDYVEVNKYIIFEQHPIPIVLHELQKAARGKYFNDYDMKNGFHQFKLADLTSNRLSVLTPWGNFKPGWMPEGVPPASGILNTTMTDIFRPYLPYTVVMFDNFLSITSSLTDCYDKLVEFVTRCAERNVILGMAKTKLGYPECTFFGYKVSNGTYSLTEERKKTVTSLSMPKTQKQMQSLLGATVFFKNNIPKYAEITAILHEMTTKGFNFNKESWTKDYESHFEILKTALLDSISVTFPNYNYTFILRTDASESAWGGVLIQVTPTGTYECISLVSAKFSGPAFKWDIHKKEAYGIVGSVKSLEYILRGKFFILETDHKNILLLEKNTTPIVVRWRLYLQTFWNCKRYLQGKFNSMGDWLSRQYNLFLLLKKAKITSTANFQISNSGQQNLPPTLLNISPLADPTDYPLFLTHTLNLLVHSDSEEPERVSTLLDISSNTLSLDDMFRSCHGGKELHRGVLHTWKELNERYPGHAVPLRVVGELIRNCPVCQKVRLKYTYTLPEEHLHLKPSHYRGRIGVDTLTVTPVDIYGNCLLIVTVEHFSKFTCLYPAADHTAETMAKALFLHYTRYGGFDELISDPGSDLMSDTVKQLNLYLGWKHKVSLTDRHESNGVEPTNKKSLGHLRAYVHDKRIAHKWSDPITLGLIQNALNFTIHAETNYTAMEMKFGSYDVAYMHLPDNAILSNNAPKMLTELNDTLRIIREISKSYQQSLVLKRDNSNTVPSTLNKFQRGDFVLFLYSVDGYQLNKLDAKFLGPYEVISHIKNDVQVRNLITDAISVFHVNRLKPFIGTWEQATEAALRDSDQYYIDKFIAYRGDPLARQSIEFYIKFADGCYHWKPWSPDLFDTVQYEEFCSEIPQLSHTIVQCLKESLVLMRQTNSHPITLVAPGDTIFLDLRAIGAGWYESLELPNCDFSLYVVPLTFTSYANTQKTKINCMIPSLKIEWRGRFAVNNFFVKCWCTYKIITPNMTLISTQFITDHNLIEKCNQK